MKAPASGILNAVMMGSVATVALFLVYASLPLVGMLPGIVAPLPSIYYALKNGKMAGFAIVAVTAALLGLAADVSAVLIYLLQCGILSVAIPGFLLRGKGGVRSIVYAVSVNLSVIIAVALYFALYSGVDFHAQVLNGVNSSIEQTITLYEKAGIGGDDLAGLHQGMQRAGVLIGRIYPALVTISLGLIASLNLFLLSKIAKRFPVPLLLGDIKKYKNPEQLIWMFIVAGFAMLVDNGSVTLAAVNVLIVLAAVYFVQGIAIILHFFTTFTVPVFVRGLFYMLIAVQPFMALAVAALGVFDLWGDFRTPKKQENL